MGVCQKSHLDGQHDDTQMDLEATTFYFRPVSRSLLIIHIDTYCHLRSAAQFCIVIPFGRPIVADVSQCHSTRLRLASPVILTIVPRMFAISACLCPWGTLNPVVLSSCSAFNDQKCAYPTIVKYLKLYHIIYMYIYIYMCPYYRIDSALYPISPQHGWWLIPSPILY